METLVYRDMCGRDVLIPTPPQRIISLVPSQTELLFDLGLDESVIGITKFCVHPYEWYRNKKRVGGTKTVHLDVVRSLSPDLIIANKEENTREQIEELAREFPVWVSDIKTLAESLFMIGEIGKITRTTAQAGSLISDIRSGFAGIKTHSFPKKVLYLIWRQPWMAAGCDTFISDMITAIGWENVLSQTPRYPELDLTALTSENIDLILLSSEPYPFKLIHINEIMAVFPAAKVLLVDGEMFSWYGSRLLSAVHYFTNLVHEHPVN